MRTAGQYIEAEKQLTKQFGWTNLFDAGGTLMMEPVLYSIDGKDRDAAYIWIFKTLKCIAQVKADEHPNKETAVRFAIVMTAIKKLELSGEAK